MAAPDAIPELPVIVCPLEFERTALSRAGLGDRVELCCCGPGADRMKQWCLARGASNRSVILAGLGGGLTPALEAGSAHVITRVVDEVGESGWVPGLLPSPDAPITIVTSTRGVLSGRLARQVVNRTSGAMIIDLESVAFAAAATRLGWRWGVVRGISDDLSTVLPENIDEWVDDEGHTDWKYVMRSLLLKPTLIPLMVELRQHSQQAMKDVAKKLEALLADTSDPGA